MTVQPGLDEKGSAVRGNDKGALGHRQACCSWGLMPVWMQGRLADRKDIHSHSIFTLPVGDAYGADVYPWFLANYLLRVSVVLLPLRGSILRSSTKSEGVRNRAHPFMGGILVVRAEETCSVLASLRCRSITPLASLEQPYGTDEA